MPCAVCRVPCAVCRMLLSMPAGRTRSAARSALAALPDRRVLCRLMPPPSMHFIGSPPSLLLSFYFSHAGQPFRCRFFIFSAVFARCLQFYVTTFCHLPSPFFCVLFSLASVVSSGVIRTACCVVIYICVERSFVCVDRLRRKRASERERRELISERGGKAFLLLCYSLFLPFSRESEKECAVVYSGAPFCFNCLDLCEDCG